jgi:putative photosynthetic complex assembly protein
MSMAHDHSNMLPKGALFLACSLVLTALAATTAARVAQLPPAALPAAVRATDHAKVLITRSLRFTDRADGAVVIEDVNAKQIAGTVAPFTKSGFVRSVMRGMARDRHLRGLGADAPFELTLWNDGQLSLVDSLTGRSLELGAFGNTNRQAFLDLLQSKEAR